jgi:flagellin
MKIQTNTAANNAFRNMSVNSMNAERSIQKLSSGFRINRSGDDAAGLAIANKLRADGRGLAQAQRNTAQGAAMLQVMDGATQVISTMLDRMKELASSANSASIGDQASKLNDEFVALRSEIGRIVNTTEYQGTKLVNGPSRSRRTSR